MTDIDTPQTDQPPRTDVGVLGWLKQNLFSNWLNTLLTILLVVAVFYFARGIFNWIFFEANWRVITSNYRVLTWGRYPEEEVWRLAVSLGGTNALESLYRARHRSEELFPRLHSISRCIRPRNVSFYARWFPSTIGVKK